MTDTLVIFTGSVATIKAYSIIWVDWGDGNKGFVTLSNYTVSHTYTYPGKYIIIIREVRELRASGTTGRIITNTSEQKRATLTYEMMKKLYPVGSIYMSVNSTNPGTRFYGGWEQIKDKFLLGCGDTYTNGSTGGEATHTLTVNEMPSHAHSRSTAPQGFAERDNSKGDIICINANYAAKKVTKYNNNTGGGAAHNNMPPYLTVYMWRRVV